MKKSQSNPNVLSWIIRVFLILVILLFMMFSMDVFASGQNFKEILLGFLIHNIPAFLLVVILIFSWRREDIGGWLLIIAGISMMFYFGGPAGLMFGTWIMIGLPVLTGILFLVNHYLIKGDIKKPKQ